PSSSPNPASTSSNSISTPAPPTNSSATIPINTPSPASNAAIGPSNLVRSPPSRSAHSATPNALSPTFGTTAAPDGAKPASNSTTFSLPPLPAWPSPSSPFPSAPSPAAAAALPAPFFLC